MNYIHHFQLLIRSVYPIRYSISLITFFPYKPGISNNIPICLSCCKIPTFGYNSTGRKNVDFQWGLVERLPRMLVVAITSPLFPHWTFPKFSL